jgi:hypothetical protein
MRTKPSEACVLIGLLVAAAPAWAQGVTAEHDFRGRNFDTQMLVYAGPEPAKYIQPEEEGLRMRFGPPDIPKQPVGIAWQTRVLGNFVATARYEILQNETPKRGYGVGVELYLMLDNPARDGIAFARQIHPAHGTVVSFNHNTNNEQGKRYGKLFKHVPTTDASKRGRLRLARVGTELTASLAEGDADEFQEIVRYEIGDVDLRLVRLAALPGGDPNATLDFRVIDFQLKGDLPGLDGLKLRSSKLPAAPGGADEPEHAEPERRKPWFLVGILLLVFGLGVTFAAVFLFVWLRRVPAKATRSTAPKHKEPIEAEPRPTVGRLTCAACGQKIKLKEGMAGKRVKCPGCGEAVQVPAD